MNSAINVRVVNVPKHRVIRGEVAEGSTHS
jgi:hypothetical protein